MKQFALAALFATFFFFSDAQAKTDTTGAMKNLTIASQKMLALFLHKDYTEYIKFIHPKILEIFGGRDKMLSTLQASMDQMKGQGFEIENVTVGTIKSIIVTPSGLQSVVPQIVELKTAEAKIISNGYLIGISDDYGKTWHFIDTGGKKLKQVQEIFPTLDSRLVIPTRQQPLVYKN